MVRCEPRPVRPRGPRLLPAALALATTLLPAAGAAERHRRHKSVVLTPDESMAAVARVARAWRPAAPG